MSTPVIHVNDVGGDIVFTCTWTGDATAYVSFTLAVAGVQLWQGAISRHQDNDMVVETLTSANASTYGAVIMSLQFLNDNVFSITFSGTIIYQNDPVNLINVEITQFSLAAAAERPRPLPSR
jgi:hypothetical protein